MNLRFRAAAEVGTALFLVGLDIGPVEVLVHHIPIGAEHSALVCGQCGKLFQGNQARQGSTPEPPEGDRAKSVSLFAPAPPAAGRTPSIGFQPQK